MNLEPNEIPVALDFYLSSVRHKRRSYRRLRHRSGWMRVTHAYFPFTYEPFERQLVVCVDDHEDFIPPDVAARLVAMTTSLPYEPDEAEPVDDLDLFQSALLQDFASECHREAHKFLEQYDELEADDLRKVADRFAKARSEIEAILRKFRSDLRGPRLDIAQRDVIEKKITAVETLYEKLPYAHLGEERRIRTAGNAVEREVLNSLSRQPTCETINVVRWRTVD